MGGLACARGLALHTPSIIRWSKWVASSVGKFGNSGPHVQRTEEETSAVDGSVCVLCVPSIFVVRSHGCDVDRQERKQAELHAHIQQ